MSFQFILLPICVAEANFGSIDNKFRVGCQNLSYDFFFFNLDFFQLMVKLHEKFSLFEGIFVMLAYKLNFL